MSRLKQILSRKKMTQQTSRIALKSLDQQLTLVIFEAFYGPLPADLVATCKEVIIQNATADFDTLFKATQDAVAQYKSTHS